MRWIRATLILSCAALLGCTAAKPETVPPKASASCAGGESTAPLAPVDQWTAMPKGTVSSVEIRGLGTVSESLVRAAIGEREGSELDLEWVREDLRAISRLEAFAEVSAHAESTGPGYVALSYVVSERPLISGIVIEGSLFPERVLGPPQVGELYDPAATRRAAQRIGARHRAVGWDEATVKVHTQRVGDRVNVCIEVRPGQRRLIASIDFEGNEQISDDALKEVIETHDGYINTTGGIYHEEGLVAAFESMRALYTGRGLFDARIHAPQVGRRDDEGRIGVRVQVDEGRVYRLGRVTIEGDLRAEPERYEALVTLSPGDVFNISLLTESIGAMYALEEELGRDGDAVEIVLVPNAEEEGLEAGLVDVAFEVRAIGEDAP